MFACVQTSSETNTERLVTWIRLLLSGPIQEWSDWTIIRFLADARYGTAPGETDGCRLITTAAASAAVVTVNTGLINNSHCPGNCA